MAYAALVSLLQTTEQVLSFDPYFIPCTKKQIQSFQETIGSLIHFLDNCSPINTQTVNNFVTKIRDAAYKAEDVFETLVANQFRGNSGSNENGLLELPQSLEKVLEEIDSIKKEMKEVEDGSGGIIEQRVSTLTGSSRSAASGTKSFVTLDDDLTKQIMEQLVGDQSKLEVIPIVGMGGIGKTTLAKTLFNHTLIGKKFYVRGWVTISQEYNVPDIVLHLLYEVGQVTTKQKSQSNTEDLNLHLYRYLSGRRYLIVLDDVWNIEAWDHIKMLFPDNNNRSRIMLTTRQSEVVSNINTATPCHQMKLLNKDVGWNLFCHELFGKDDCPSELVEIGQQIAKSCKGLPLAISVICGILSKENMTKEYWEYVAQNLNLVLMSNDEQCLEILSLSYKYLPHLLKACFLYFGVFREDYKVSVSTLIEMWVAEGFLKQINSKSMEELGKECLKDLIDRNLILVHEYGSYGKPKTCGIHDLLRDICIREAQKEKFLVVLNRSVLSHPSEVNTGRRLSIHPSVMYGYSRISDDGSSSDNDEDSWVDASTHDVGSSDDDESDLLNAMGSMPIIRSFVCANETCPSKNTFRISSRLVKVLHVPQHSKRFPKKVLDFVNLKYLTLGNVNDVPSISRLWNLETFNAYDTVISHPSTFEIWEMPQLRHLRFKYFYLADAEYRGTKSCVLNNLETLSGVRNLRFTEAAIKRFPNVRKLGITYESCHTKKLDWSYYCLNNLVKLCKLESLNLDFWEVPKETLMKNLCLPFSLKKLVLRLSEIPWEQMTIIGKLPNLKVLKLRSEACKGPVWEPNEEEFTQLEFLLIEEPQGLVEWRAERTHFPNLRHLVLIACNDLESLPSGIGEIPTLEIVKVYECNTELDSSAKEILREDSDIELIIHPRQESSDDDF